jgi:hypothetical protein
MRHYFPHYLDNEVLRCLGESSSVLQSIKENMKYLALLGARLSLGDIMLVHSPIMHDLMSDPEFRLFIKAVDPHFITLEAGSLPVGLHSNMPTREKVARRAWDRIVQPDWKSHSLIRTDTMQRGAEIALETPLGDQVQFSRRLDERLIHITDAQRTLLLNTFEVISWFGTDPRALVHDTRANEPENEPTYYAKILEALLVEGLDGESYARLDRARCYVEGLPVDDDQRRLRSVLVSALERDRSLGTSEKEEIRSTVAYAWTSAMSVGMNSQASLSVTPPRGVVVPRLLEAPSEVIGDANEIEAIVLASMRRRVVGQFLMRMSHLSWRDVCELVEATDSSRAPLTRGVEDGSATPDLQKRHAENLCRKIESRYPKPTLTGVSAVGASGLGVLLRPMVGTEIAASVATSTLIRNAGRWSRGRVMTATVRRLTIKAWPAGRRTETGTALPDGAFEQTDRPGVT